MSKLVPSKIGFFLLKTVSWFFTASICFFMSCQKAEKKQPPAIPVTVTKATIRAAPIYYEYVGHVEASKTIEIRSQVEGIITKQHFVEGQEVEEGDLLFTIDSRPYDAALQKAEAALALSIANLKYSQETASRYSKLVNEEFVAELDYDQYLTNVLVNEATIKQNIADIETAKINLSYCSILSPLKSIVGVTQVYEGNLIQNAEGTPLVTLNQITPININFYIPEKDFPRIQSLQRKQPLLIQTFLSENYEHPFEGILTNIDNQVDETTGMILLKATLLNEDKRLWPGQYVSIRIVLEIIKDAILLPSQAVQIGQNGPYIYVIKEDATVELRPLNILQKEDKFIIVKDGIKKDETIVLDGQLNLRPGSYVTIVSKEAL